MFDDLIPIPPHIRKIYINTPYYQILKQSGQTKHNSNPAHQGEQLNYG